MNEIDKKKYINIINKKNTNKEPPPKTPIKTFLIKLFILLITFLSVAIVCKENPIVKEKVIKYLYSEDISFTKIKNLYNKYLGGILPIKKEALVEETFNENLKYISSTKYLEGVKLEVSENYLVPAIKEGMVVFVGEKEGYGKTIIIEDLEGICTWYGNIENSSLKLYDYVEKSTLVGEVNQNLYLVFSKDDKYLDYEKYLK